MSRKSQYHANRIEILRAISGFMRERHKTPSIRDVADRTGIAVGTLYSYMEQLAEEGLIEWRPKKHRTLRLTTDGSILAEAEVPF